MRRSCRVCARRAATKDSSICSLRNGVVDAVCIGCSGFHDEREHTQTERDSKLLTKERLLDDKDEELLRERRAHRELLEKLQALIEDTKMEKAHVRS
jgi:hypothetical protein